MFEIVFYTLFAIGWGAFGYQAINATFYENTAWSQCKNIIFENETHKHYLGSVHYYNAASWSTEFDQLLVSTFKICFKNNCITSKDRNILPAHAYFESKKNYLFLDVPKLKPGTYYYKVSTDVEGYRVMHSEKICHFTIKE